MPNEKAYQNYFMKIAKPMNYYRTSLSTGSGFPDVLGIHGARHSFVELKDIILGKRGNQKIRPLFKDSQPPWFINYFKNGGTRLFVSWRICDHDESNKKYGLWQLTKQTVLDMDSLYYSDLIKESFPLYREYQKGKEMIYDIEKWGEAK